MNKGPFIAAFVAVGLWIAPAVQAAPVQITAYATITSAAANVPSYMTGYQAPFVLGDQITATLSYDSDAMFGTVPVSGSYTAYWPASGRITTSTGWSREAFSWFNVAASQITFTGQSGDPRYVSGFPLFYYTASLSFGEPFATIPPYPVDASDFFNGVISGLYAETPFLDASFTARIDRITAMVTPIPGGLALFATALAGLAAVARKRRQAAP